MRDVLFKCVVSLNDMTRNFRDACILLNHLEDAGRLQQIEIIRLRDTISELQGKKKKVSKK